jgi:hypothetical protein
MPIVAEVAAMLRGETSPFDVMATLMRRGATTEMHDLPGPAGSDR